MKDGNIKIFFARFLLLPLFVLFILLVFGWAFTVFFFGLIVCPIIIFSFIAKKITTKRILLNKQKVNYKKLGGWWFIIPFLIWLSEIVLFIFVGFTSGFGPQSDLKDFGGVAITIFFGLWGIWGIIQHYNEKWENYLKSIQKNENELSHYKNGYNYTDSSIEPVIYLIAKIICYLITITTIGIVAFFGFSWLGTITIAPTTIIIILLLIIIANQNQKKQS